MTDSPRFSWIAVAIGSATDIGGTIAASFVVGAVAGLGLAMAGKPVDLQLMSDTGLLIVDLTVSLVFSCLGGFVAARLAKRAELAHAAATALVCLGLGLLIARMAPNRLLPPWYVIAGDLLVVPAALLGGLLARRRNLRASAA